MCLLKCLISSSLGSGSLTDCSQGIDRLHRHNTGGHDGDGNEKVAKQHGFAFSATRNEGGREHTKMNFPLAISLPVQSPRQRESKSAPIYVLFVTQFLRIPYLHLMFAISLLPLSKCQFTTPHSELQ